MKWKTLQPNKHGDWLSQRNDVFNEYIPLSPTKKFNALEKSFFVAQSNGILTAKDSWLINASRLTLSQNVKNMISFYNEQRVRYFEAKMKGDKTYIEDYINYDSSRISWSDLFIRDAEKNVPYDYQDNSISTINYRPFNKQKFFFDKKLIQRTYQMLKVFPKGNENNLLICISCMSSTK